MLHGSVSTCFCQTVESVSVCTAIFGQCSAKPMGASPHCLALSKINNRDWIFLKNVGYWIIVWEPWYADVGALWQILVFCTAHTRFWYLIHHCHSLITYRESYGVYFSKMGWSVCIQSHRFAFASRYTAKVSTTTRSTVFPRLIVHMLGCSLIFVKGEKCRTVETMLALTDVGGVPFTSCSSRSSQTSVAKNLLLLSVHCCLWFCQRPSLELLALTRPATPLLHCSFLPVAPQGRIVAVVLASNLPRDSSLFVLMHC